MSNSFDLLLLAVFLREPVFFTEYGTIIDSDMFESSSSKICINVYIDYITKYNKVPSDQEMYNELNMYCKKYGIDATMKQASIELLQDAYKVSYNVDYVKDNFMDHAVKNKLTTAIIDAAKDIKTKGDRLTDQDYKKIHEDIEKAITIKSRDTEGVLLSDVGDNPKEFIENQNRYSKESVIPTGFPSLDNAHIAGGPLPGELYVISAPPGRGKSTVLVNIGAYALLKGKDVVHIFVGDNTEADGVLRYCARLTGVAMSQIMLNSQQYLDSWKYLKDNFDLGNLLLGAYSIGSPSIGDLRSFVTKNMTRKGIKPVVLIVDYIDNCRRNPNLNSYEALGDLYTELKNLCEELKLVGWTASQPKVETWDDTNPGLSSLAESSKKQHVLDGMLTLSKASDTSYSLYVPKLRRGRSEFQIDLQVNYEKMSVKESFANRIQQSSPQSSIPPHGAITPNAVPGQPVAPQLPDSASPFEGGQ